MWSWLQIWFSHSPYYINYIIHCTVRRSWAKRFLGRDNWKENAKSLRYGSTGSKNPKTRRIPLHQVFTADVWGETGPSFPYLDTALYGRKKELKFKVHLNENQQQLKYLNKGSAHTSKCFVAIPSRVIGRLAKLAHPWPKIWWNQRCSTKSTLSMQRHSRKPY